MEQKDPLLGERVEIKSEWVGRLQVAISTPFLIMAGHADSQGIAGAGTVGEAVALQGKLPMDPSIQIEYAEIIEDKIHIIARSRVQP